MAIPGPKVQVSQLFWFLTTTSFPLPDLSCGVYLKVGPKVNDGGTFARDHRLGVVISEMGCSSWG